MIPENEPGGSAAVATAPETTDETTSTRSSDSTEMGGPAPKPTAPTDGKPTGKVLPPSLVPKKAKDGQPSRFQQRISDLVAARNATDGENRVLREQLVKLTGGGGVTGKTGAVSDDPNAPLTPENYETYAEYVSALVNRTIEQREAARSSQRGEQAMVQHRDERMTAFHEAAAPMVEQYGEDFMSAISDPTLPVSEAMADAVLELDDIGPYIMLHLANNRQECAQMARMNPRAATVAIGRLAARLDYELKQNGEGAGAGAAPGAAAAPASTVSVNQAGGMASAPPAPKPVPVPRGSSPASITGQPNDRMPMSEWMQAERQRLREKFGPTAKFYG